MPQCQNVYGNHLITPSNVNRAIALAGNALRKQGMKPLQKPFMPLSFATAVAASFHRRNFRSPSFNPPPSGSVISRCLTTSAGYDVNQKI